ncbi:MULTISPECIES: phage tail protein [unclassified Coleofasciculus]|uniref:phage tail protein n=1 Tax=unclassified Coleofasciculus TaxID=2692782 RepID=UPI001881DDCA|nr:MULTISPECIES: phage tail protein [unclassified Coleofasciculus]MBE9126981.1 phage tail protein [Coleofasciculus sp. LEGE 07081]MBE9150336.1 phage tail protein [Coleofasciculus sp. LEGE 07092]
MADLLKPLAPSSFALDIDGLGELVFKSVKIVPNKPKVSGESAPLGSGKDGKSYRQINSAGFEEISTFEAVSISSPSATSASVVMWKWFQDCLPPSDGGNGKWKDSKKTGSIFCYDHDDELVAQWDIKEAWPSSYSLAELSVESNKPLEETWTITCENMTRVM